MGEDKPKRPSGSPLVPPKPDPEPDRASPPPRAFASSCGVEVTREKRPDRDDKRRAETGISDCRNLGLIGHRTGDPDRCSPVPSGPVEKTGRNGWRDSGMMLRLVRCLRSSAGQSTGFLKSTIGRREGKPRGGSAQIRGKLPAPRRPADPEPSPRPPRSREGVETRRAAPKGSSRGLRWRDSPGHERAVSTAAKAEVARNLGSQVRALPGTPFFPSIFRLRLGGFHSRHYSCDTLPQF